MRVPRVTIWGLAALFALIGSPVAAIWCVLHTDAAVLPSFANYAIGSATGWLLVKGIFRWEHRPLIVAPLAFVGVLLLIVAPRIVPAVAYYVVVYGMTFGAFHAWAPHCWGAIGVRPPMPVDWLAGRNEATFRRYIVRFQSRRALDRISTLRRQGKRDQALEAARAYADRCPDDYYAWTTWASILVEAGEAQDAEAVLQRAVENLPGSVQIRCQLADVLIEQSRIDDARDLLERQRLEHPDSPLPYLFLAKLAVADSDWDGLFALTDQTLERWANAPVRNDPRVA